jgi:type VI secretion system secreted protein VgrG
MAGAQTAVVVGPKGEETYTDEYGRVKVRFHWDRLSPDNGESSCWIRVASTWAGSKWGGFQVPRVGQEVVVDFLEGSPDRPLITGSVYNAEQMPPFDANPTQSGWKSHSTKNGGAESNEFRFEDKKGSEEIYLRAEKDHKVVVVNDEAFEIGHDRTATVENDDTLTVKKDQKITVKNNQTATIENNQKITVEKGNRSLQVKKGNLTTKAAFGKISFEAMQAIELKVGPTTVKIEPSGVTISGPMVKVEAKGVAEIKGALTKVEGQGPVMVKGAPVMVKGTPTMIG